MVGYALGIAFYASLILQLTALLAVLGLLGLFTWIGYTMFTEPPSPEHSASELDDLQPETIYPSGTMSALKRPEFSVIADTEIGESTVVGDHVSLHKCKIGNNCKIESFVCIEEGVTIGDNCTIKPHVFIPTGVQIENEVFIGPNVTFTKYPRVKADSMRLETVVGRGASIGANTVILLGITIGREAVVDPGSVVVSDVPDGAIVSKLPKSMTK